MPRKKAFSGKQKKVQLQAKKQSNIRSYEGRADLPYQRDEDNLEESGATIISKGAVKGDFEGSKFFENRPAPSRMNAGKFALTFRTESKGEVLRLKEEARKTLIRVEGEYLECKSDDFFTPELDFPKRPPWNRELSREALERNESRYFQDYLMKIDDTFEKTDLSYFELNLETWRQFWRVLEMSDILLCVVDIRFPPLLFPPSLYDYVKTVGKDIIVVLNKVDLCPAPLVLAWKDYFTKTYEGLQVVCFTSYPSYNLHGNMETTGLKKGKKVRGRVRMAAEGALEVYKTCENFVQGQVDLSLWKNKILEEMSAEDQEADEREQVLIEKEESLKKQDVGYYEFKKFHSGILTIGCIGQPNTGKSSLINALMGKKVVSVSKTPGHTKHFQTIFLTQNVRLCDCPGLIFPSKVPKPLQVLCGSYPIAQLREPYSTVQYLGARLDLSNILGIQHPEGKEETEWSAIDIADGWALKRGYYTAKTSRLDSYRGANHILRLTLEGRICFCLLPPEYSSKESEFTADPRIQEIVHIQAKAGTGNTSKTDEKITDFGSDYEDDNNQSEGEESEDNLSLGTDDEENTKKTEAIQSKHDKKVVKTQNKFAMLNQSDDDESEDD